MLFGLIDKTLLCRCGCHGRHTLNGMFQVFAWSITCLIEGIHPVAKHDGGAWLKSDKTRSSNSKKKFGFGGKLDQCRGDWMWLKGIFGGWQSENVCWRCVANRHEMPFDDFSKNAKYKNVDIHKPHS